MTSSGTVSTTVFETRKVIDRAFRRCRIQSELISGELLTIAQDNLYLFLSHLANLGAPLWCIDKQILPLYQGQVQVPAPVGTVDILNSQLRTLQRPGGTPASSSGTAANAFDGVLPTACTQSAPNGNISIDYGIGSPTQITTFGFYAETAQTLSLVVEYSSDNTNWTQALACGSTSYGAQTWTWYDMDGTPAMEFWRIRETAGGTINAGEVYFGNLPNEIPLARLNQDDYTALPNKTFQGQPTQFWLNRLVTQPILYIWPATGINNIFNQIIIWRERYIQDVGSLTQTLDIPQRWYEAITWGLAYRLSQELTYADLPQLNDAMIANIGSKAAQSLQEAQDEERDNSPTNFYPMVSVYTA